jgi:hypothetical protein
MRRARSPSWRAPSFPCSCSGRFSAASSSIGRCKSRTRRSGRWTR